MGGIQAVFSCDVGGKSNHLKGTGIKHEHLDAKDDGTMSDDEFMEKFRQAAEQIFEWLCQGKNVLLHCQAGISRSPSIAVCLFVKRRNMTVKNAIKLIQDRRKIVNPRRWARQLRYFQKQYYRAWWNCKKRPVWNFTTCPRRTRHKN